LYDADTLLDELHDEDSPRVVRSLDLDDEEDGDLGIDGDLDDGLIVDGEVDELDTSDDALLSADETESWSDDPVRMYLTQMGEIPLLTRQQEISLAKQIEITRAKFRRKLLECDYVMQQAVRVLRRVHDGELPFDRTVQVSVTDRLEKDQILGRLPHNLRTLEILLKRNRRDYRAATSKSRPLGERQEAWRRLGRCRKRAVRLIEELGLRTQRIEPLIGTLEEFSRRVDELRETPDGWQVEVTILVNRPSQKPIVIGPKGRTLHQVREAAEQELGEQYGVGVTLSLWVKVERNWMGNFWILRQMGYAGER